MPFGMVFQSAKDFVAQLLVERARLEAERVEVGIDAFTLRSQLFDRRHQFGRIALSTDQRANAGITSFANISIVSGVRKFRKK